MKTVNEELIARSSVLNLLEVFPFDGDVHDMERIEDEVKEIPSVDVVRHGYWIHCKGKSNLWYCSECSEQILFNPNPRTWQGSNKSKRSVSELNRFCRGCGAKMDKEHSGYWIRTGNTNVYGCFEIECSECHERIVIGPDMLDKQKFCFNCGIHMKEIESEEQ